MSTGFSWMLFGVVVMAAAGHGFARARRPGGDPDRPTAGAVESPSAEETLGQLVTHDLPGDLPNPQPCTDRLDRALQDPLTGLPNRQLLTDRLDQALARAARRSSTLAVMRVGLDRLGEVNALVARRVGDALLVEASQRMREVLRADDTLARLGDDQFVVVCESLDETTAGAIADRLATTLGQPFELGGDWIGIQASVGVALASGDGPDVDALLRQADAALGRARAAGGGQHEVHSAAGDRWRGRRQRLRSELEDASVREELQLAYQPLVALGSEPAVPASGDVVVGVEALLRWRNRVEGWVSPSDFIPVAESTGQIVAVGSWALHEACRQAAWWRRMSPADCAFTVFVNLSPRQLTEPTVVDGLVRSLEETGADPAGLGLEITERVVLAEDDDVVATLEMLIALGVRLAVDDFGTGYSCLRQLRRFPIDLIKIDARYVAGLERQITNRAMISSVTGMARELGIAVCAEGVETAAQLDIVRDLGCHMAQGFYLGRPAPPAAIDGLLGAGRRDLRESDA